MEKFDTTALEMEITPVRRGYGKVFDENRVNCKQAQIKAQNDGVIII